MKLQFMNWIRFFSAADWLDNHRARGYSRVLLGLTVLGFIGILATSANGLDITGKNLGTDFISFWTASELALSGQPVAVYDADLHFQAQINLFPVITHYTAFFYPPPFLLICLPFALLPYTAALSFWLLTTLSAYLLTLNALLDKRISLVPVIAYPAVIITLGHGQNSFLTAALMAGGILCLQKRPVVAGLLLGLLIFKPHLGLVIPVVLIAGQRWKSFFAACFSSFTLCFGSLTVFGISTWQAFFSKMHLAKIALDHNMVGHEKMVSVFAGFSLMGYTNTSAYLAQIITTLCVCLALVWMQRYDRHAKYEGAGMATGALLASPFALDYDLTLLAIPMAILVSQGIRHNFLTYEKTVLLFVFTLPLFSRAAAKTTALPIAQIIIAALFFIIIRRVVHEKKSGVLSLI